MIGRYTPKERFVVGLGVLVLIFLIILSVWYAAPRVPLNTEGHYEEQTLSAVAAQEINKQTQEFGAALEEEKSVLEEKKKVADTKRSQTPPPVIDPRINADPVVKEHVETMPQQLFLPPDVFELPPR